MTNPNDIAYPNKSQNRQIGITDFYGGLTKREYFAALAMQGMWANESSIVAMAKAAINEDLTQTSVKGTEMLAKLSIAAADALIAELNKEKP